MDTEITDPIETVDAPETPEIDPKEANRKGFEQRQEKKRLEDLTRELEGYKRREEEARKATLTETQRLKEELDAIKAERERETMQRLKEKVAAKFKLPDVFVNRLVGSDETSLEADAEEISKQLPRQRVGVTSDPVKETTSPSRTYKESQLSDRAFYKAHEADILKAYREGRIVRGE